MKIPGSAQIVGYLLFGICASIPSAAQQDAPASNIDFPTVPSRVVERVDDTRLVRLVGNTHPSAQPKYDQGLVESGKRLEKIVLVLKRSPEQEKALADFNERQYEPESPDFHHWLHAGEFGRLYGPSDADIAAVTSWLQNHGFTIDLVTEGRVTIQFSGTVAQVQEAFHLEMHRYLVGGMEHIANDRDPSIPEALFPVITGIASLTDFFPVHDSHAGNLVKRDLKTGKYTLWDPEGSLKSKSESGQAGGTSGTEPGAFLMLDNPGGVKPDLGWIDPNTGYQREDLSPYDVATIYNILPLWNEAKPINGTGVKVAIVALSDVLTADFNTFRKSFGLPAGTLTTLHSGADPGYNSKNQPENTEDTEMVSATAPGAQVILVADPYNATTDGLMTAATYIIEKEIAPIMTMSYLECELALGDGGNAMWSKTFQQATTEGITPFVCAGDSGSSICTLQNGTPPYGDTYGLAVNGMASNPFVTAVGGTDVQWPFVEGTNPPSTYWNATADSHGATAKGYMPEMSWNATCSNPILLNVYTSYSNVEALCNAAITGLPGLVRIASGSGGVSACTTNSTTSTSTSIDPSSCSGGYAKPSWQTGVKGIPADGKRDLPDVSLFASYGFDQSTGIPGSALLVCFSFDNSEDACNYSDPTQIIYQENGGTSAASPMTAGIMAMIEQKTGEKQGLANHVFYSLAAKENYANCNSSTVKAGNSCIFYDTTYGSNAMVCKPGDPDCVTNTQGDQAGIIKGYSATAGFDLTTGLGTMNVANLVNAWPTSTPTNTITLSPTSVTFPNAVEKTTSDASTVTLKNAGTTTIAISSIATSSTVFPVLNTCGTTLAKSSSCSIFVAFSPTTAAASTGTLKVSYTGGTGTSVSIALKGTGTAAPAVKLSATALAFATTKHGSVSEEKPVTLTNSGTVTLDLKSITLTGTNPSDFEALNTCGATLAPAASCTVYVAFKPAAAAAYTAKLTITDNGSASPQSVTLTGTGN